MPADRNHVTESAPASVVRAVMAAVSDGRYDDIRPLLADDAVLHVPYLHGDSPGATGAEAVHAYLTKVMTRTFAWFHFIPVQTYQVDDGETVVMEYSSEAEFRQTSEPYRNRYVGIFRVQDGRLQMYKEYFDPREAGVPLRRPRD